jgi:hypothetical protein
VTNAAGLEAAQDLSGWTAQDVRVVEASPEEEEEQVVRQGQDDQESSSDVLNGPQMGSGVLSRNNIASRSQVSSPKTTDPPAPKLVNWS